MHTITNAAASPLIAAAENERRFDWPVCQDAENFIGEQIDAFLPRNEFARNLAARMRDETGTLLLDWIDHIEISSRKKPALLAAGFTQDAKAETANGQCAFEHREALLPPVLLSEWNGEFPARLAIRVESVDDFLKAQGLVAQSEGQTFSRYRRATVCIENGTRFEAIERRGYRGFVADESGGNWARRILTASELWSARHREFDADAEGYRETHELLDRVIGIVGRDLACHIVFAGEREFWQRRNRAAQVQRRRQDQLGLGWANHDHHTFRSSREHFVDLMSVMDKLGFERRERSYTGSQAGWGAQILEQPVEGIVVFADLDLMPDETDIDFSRRPLKKANRLGTVGLWVGLHGESFLSAGMHHLEARFDFALVREQLNARQIIGMPPFSDFDFLKQAFTEGERWSVNPKRAERLRHDGLITTDQFEQFIREGAIGSHLETLQRRGGFKGFNQKSVSAIIAATDPRKQKHD